MAIRFPVTAAVRSNAHDRPKPAKAESTIGLFDRVGYWASIGTGAIELPLDQLDMGHRIAAFVNAAYEQGKEDAREAMREALGLANP